MNIAICDDNESTCEIVSKVILRLKRKFREPLNVMSFLSGCELKNYLTDGNTFDLIFLDIEMAGINGIEVGKFIRDEQSDNLTHIIYISQKSSYAMALFENRPLDFLVKPLSEAKIISSVQKSYEIKSCNNAYIEFYNDKAFNRVAYKDILYFQSCDKKIQIITQSGICEFYGKLKNISSIVPKDNYVQIHKSHIVNLTYATKIYYDGIELINGQFLSISAPNRTAVRNWMVQRSCNFV